MRHQRAALVKQVLAQCIQVIAGPGSLTKDSSVEILDREKIVMNVTRERDKCSHWTVVCCVQSTTQVGGGGEGGGRVKGVKQAERGKISQNPTPLKSRSLMWRVVGSFCAVRGFSAVILVNLLQKYKFPHLVVDFL